MKNTLILSILIFISVNITAQSRLECLITVRDELTKDPIPNAKVDTDPKVGDEQISDIKGVVKLVLPENKRVEIIIKANNYETKSEYYTINKNMNEYNNKTISLKKISQQ